MGLFVSRNPTILRPLFPIASIGIGLSHHTFVFVYLIIKSFLYSLDTLSSSFCSLHQPPSLSFSFTMPLFDTLYHTFCHNWDEISLASWRKYPCHDRPDVLSVDIVDKHFDPETGVLTATRW